MTDEPFLVTSTGGRIYRHKDDPPLTYRIPGGVAITGWQGETIVGTFVTQVFNTSGTIELEVEEE